MVIIISDAQCLCRLKELNLIHPILKLPHSFHVPSTTWDEIYGLPAKEIEPNSNLLRRVLDGDSMKRVCLNSKKYQQLCMSHQISLELLSRTKGGVLLSSDNVLTSHAVNNSIPIKDELWLINELLSHTSTPKWLLAKAIEELESDKLTQISTKNTSNLLKKVKEAS